MVILMFYFFFTGVSLIFSRRKAGYISDGVTGGGGGVVVVGGGPICVQASLAPKRYVGSTMPVKPKLLGIKFRATLLGAMEDDGRRPVRRKTT